MAKLAALFCFAASALAQTYVSSTNFDDATGASFTTVTATFSGGVTTGNLIACFIRYGNSSNPALTVALTGTGGDSFTQAGTNAEESTSNWSGMYYKFSATGNASYVVTATFSASGYASYVGMVCGQYSGVGTVSAFDQAAQGVNPQSAGTDPWNFCTTGAFTTTAAHEVIILGSTGGGTYVAQGGMTIRAVSGSGQAVLSDIVVTSIQTALTATMDGGMFNNWNCNLATFQAATVKTTSVRFIF
jgi:hypothetical protein